MDNSAKITIDPIKVPMNIIELGIYRNDFGRLLLLKASGRQTLVKKDDLNAVVIY